MADRERDALPALLWPAAQATEALWTLARTLGWAPAARPWLTPTLAATTLTLLGEALEAAARALNLSAEAVDTTYAGAAISVRDIAPAVLPVMHAAQWRLLVVLSRRGSWLQVLAPDGRTLKVRASAITATLCTELETPHRGAATQLIDQAGFTARQRERLTTALLREQLRDKRLFIGWLLRPAPRRSLWHSAREVGAVRLIALFLVVYALQFTLGSTTLLLAGNAALSGRLDRGYMLGWLLLIFTQLPLQLMGGWLQGRLAIAVGLMSRKRLLHGILGLDHQHTRHSGYGHFLGQVIEAETVEQSLFSGGLLALTAGAELGLSAIALTVGAGQVAVALLLLLWIALIAAAGWRYYRAARAYTESRLAMTHATIEQMLGHRTRLAQQPAAEWHKEEEDALLVYQPLWQLFDRRALLLTSFAAPAFLVVGIVALLPSWVSASLSAARVALSIAALLFAYQALAKLAPNLTLLANALVSWQKARALFQNISAEPGALAPLAPPTRAPGKVLLQARGVSFRYAPTTPLVLDGCELTIRTGDRILLEGPSGSGKSTLMALLAGLQQPSAGLLLLDGLDHLSIGLPGWRRRVVAAPQFHENHILAESLAFNLLLGRSWPPTALDLADAEAVCHELGLAALLGRMPAGLHQIVGDSGWQLSHGEKSRVYIARALLQRAELVVLDESFAALDPESLAQALRCVQRRAATLVVIAHP